MTATSTMISALVVLLLGGLAAPAAPTVPAATPTPAPAASSTQDGQVFRPARELDGYEAAYFGDYERLYDFSLYEELDGARVSAQRLAELVTSWEAERARVALEIARFEADPAAGWVSEVIFDLAHHTGLRDVSWRVDESIPGVALALPVGEGVDERLLASSRMEYDGWIAALLQRLAADYTDALPRPRRDDHLTELLLFVQDDEAYARTLRGLSHWERRSAFGLYDTGIPAVVMHETQATRAHPEQRLRTVLAQLVRSQLHAHATRARGEPLARWVLDGLSEHLSVTGRVSAREPNAADLGLVDRGALETLRTLYALPERASFVRPTLELLLSTTSWQHVDQALKERLPAGVEPDGNLRTQAWAAFGASASLFVAWLHADPTRRVGFQRALEATLDGGSGVELFTTAFPDLPLDQAQREYRAWTDALQREQFPGDAVLDLGFAGAPPAVAAAPPPPAGSGGGAGDGLAGADRSGEARGAEGESSGGDRAGAAGRDIPQADIEALVAAQQADAARVALAEAAFATWRQGRGARLLEEAASLSERVTSEQARGSSSWGRSLRASHKPHSLRGKRGGRGRTTASERKGLELLEGPARLGVVWLLAHQNHEGLWSSADFSDSCGLLAEGYCSGGGAAHHDTGVTALALMCLLRADPSPGADHAPALRMGLERLAEVQSRNGRVPPYTGGSTNYDHAMATLALVEAVAAGYEDFRPAAQRALEHLIEQRTVHSGWRYSDKGAPTMVTHPVDASMTSWALQALAAARDAGLEVDTVAIEEGLQLLDHLTDAHGRTGYVEPGGGSSRPEHSGLDPYTERKTEAMTAAALLARLAVDREGTLEDEAGTLDRGLALLFETPVSWRDDSPLERIDYYYWSAATRVLAQVGGSERGVWLADLYDMVCAAGLEHGDALGSWPTLDVWSQEGGRVYSTAIMTLALLELSASG